MAEISRPDFTYQWSSGGSIVAPSNTKIQTGWTAEVPPFQWENWAQNRQDNALVHLFQKGISLWSPTQDYYYTVSGPKAYVQGSNGLIYMAVQSSTNQNPVTDVSNTYWKIAFSSTDIATTSTPGIVQLATTAAMTTGTSTTLVPPVSAIAAQLPFRGIAQFSTVGTFTWTVPTGVTKAWVYVTGSGGGGGGSGSSTGAAGGGGGAGATALKLVSLVGVPSVSITIPAGGAGGTGSSGTGSLGGTTSFGGIVTAGGGNGGSPSAGNSAYSGSGSGSVSGGDITLVGGAGRNSLVGVGFNAGGIGGDSYFGKGAGAALTTGSTTIGVNGSPGIFGSGGGGGASYNASSSGGTGGPGYILIIY